MVLWALQHWSCGKHSRWHFQIYIHTNNQLYLYQDIEYYLVFAVQNLTRPQHKISAVESVNICISFTRLFQSYFSTYHSKHFECLMLLIRILYEIYWEKP